MRQASAPLGLSRLRLFPDEVRSKSLSMEKKRLQVNAMESNKFGGVLMGRISQQYRIGVI